VVRGEGACTREQLGEAARRKLRGGVSFGKRRGGEKKGKRSGGGGIGGRGKLIAFGGIVEGAERKGDFGNDQGE